jgi:tetratricopeptide (TPR) repeat protein
MGRVQHRTLILLAAFALVGWAGDGACDARAETRECARILSNLGSVYYSETRYREAEPLLSRAIALWLSSSPESVDLAITLHNLAAVYRAEARYADAIPLDERSLSLRDTIEGSNSASLLSSLNGLALSHMELA